MCGDGESGVSTSDGCCKAPLIVCGQNTRLCEEFENGKISICSKEEYIRRVAVFLENLSPDIVVERLFSRVPEKDAVFSNWGKSWWALRDELLEYMDTEKSYQGKKFNYLGGAALDKIQGV